MFFILIMLVKGFYKWQQIIVKNIYTKTLKKKYYLFEKKLEEPSTIALIMGYFCG